MDVIVAHILKHERKAEAEEDKQSTENVSVASDEWGYSNVRRAGEFLPHTSYRVEADAWQKIAQSKGEPHNLVIDLSGTIRIPPYWRLPLKRNRDKRFETPTLKFSTVQKGNVVTVNSRQCAMKMARAICLAERLARIAPGPVKVGKLCIVPLAQNFLRQVCYGNPPRRIPTPGESLNTNFIALEHCARDRMFAGHFLGAVPQAFRPTSPLCLATISLYGSYRRRPLRIDLPQNPLRPFNRVRNAEFQRWAWPVDLRELARPMMLAAMRQR